MTPTPSPGRRATAALFATATLAAALLGGPGDAPADAPPPAESPAPEPAREPGRTPATETAPLESEAPAPEPAPGSSPGAGGDAAGSRTGPAAGAAAPPGTLQVGPFSTQGGALPQDWEPLEFENIPDHTRYDMEPSEGAWAVHARSEGAASGLIREIDIDLRTHPVVRWRWKAEGLIQGSDPTQKAGDDYAARLYIAFRYEPERVGFLRRATYLAARAVLGDLPYGAINYIWSTDTPPGSIVDNPYAGSFVKMIVVQSGPDRLGEWIVEQRNVREDYLRAFGEEPPRVQGVAIMTDTDNTGESASAWYGDIEFLPAQEASPQGAAPRSQGGARASTRGTELAAEPAGIPSGASPGARERTRGTGANREPGPRRPSAR